MFSETGCVPGIDGEEVPAETIVPDAKEYISETIDDPEAIYDPEIWDTSGFALVLSWLAQKWNQRCRKLAPLGSKNPGQHLTKEQQKVASAAPSKIRRRAEFELYLRANTASNPSSTSWRLVRLTVAMLVSSAAAIGCRSSLRPHP